MYTQNKFISNKKRQTFRCVEIQTCYITTSIDSHRVLDMYCLMSQQTLLLDHHHRNQHTTIIIWYIWSGETGVQCHRSSHCPSKADCKVDWCGRFHFHFYFHFTLTVTFFHSNFHFHFSLLLLLSLFFTATFTIRLKPKLLWWTFLHIFNCLIIQIQWDVFVFFRLTSQLKTYISWFSAIWRLNLAEYLSWFCVSYNICYLIFHVSLVMLCNRMFNILCLMCSL